MRVGLFILLLLSAWPCTAEEVVVITHEKVPLFTLPNGTVLTNAYAWKQDSRGIMIVHDGGNYFLNYTLLPDRWKKAYLGEPTPEENTPAPEKNEPSLPIKNNPYQLGKTFKSIPGLSEKGLAWLLQSNPSDEITQKILALGILQSLLNKKQKRAKQLLLFIEENEYTITELDLKKLFQSCPKCHGEGTISHVCRICKGTGKCVRCNGMGTRKSAFDKSRYHCTNCKGTGKCPSCLGKGKFTQICSLCNGKKKILNADYCIVLRNKWVREINALTDSNAWTTITATPFSPIKSTLQKIPELKSEVKTFYTSTNYKGEMDTNLVVLCLMQALKTKEMQKAHYFNTMLEVLYPKAKIIDVKKYIHICTACNGTGVIERPCPTCHGSGKCPRCDGTGTRKSEIKTNIKKTTSKRKKKKKDKEADGIYCTTCHGSGVCTSCGGTKVTTHQCATCGGTGKQIKKLRVNVRLKIEIKRLTSFYEKENKE